MARFSDYFFKFFVFVNAEYMSPISKTSIFVALLQIITAFQIGSLAPSAIRTENLKTIFHEMVYEEGGYIEYLRLVPILHSNALIFSIVLLVILLFSTFSFIFLHSYAIYNENYGIVRLPCMCLITFFELFFGLLLIPTLDLCVYDFQCSEKDDCLAASHFIRMVASALILGLLGIIDIILRYFTLDLAYNTKNLFTQKDSRLSRIKLPLLVFLSIMYYVSYLNTFTRISSNFFHLVASLWFVVDELIHFHSDDPIVSNFYFLGYVFILWESTLNMIHSFWDMFGSDIDLDVLTVSVFFGVARLFLGLRNKLKSRVQELHFHEIKSCLKSLQYIKAITLMIQKAENSYAGKFELLSILSKHIGSCQVPKCDCKLLKVHRAWYKYSETAETLNENSQDQSLMTKSETKINHNIEDSNVVLESLLSYEVSLDQKALLKMLANFFILTLQRRKSTSEGLAYGYLSFMTFEIKNHHEALIGLAELRHKWRKSRSVNKMIMLRNYHVLLVNIANRKIGGSKDKFIQIYSSEALKYYEGIDKIEEKIESLVIQETQFLKKLMQPSVVFDELKSIGLSAVSERDEISKELEKLMLFNRRHSRVLNCYILFRSKVLHQTTKLKDALETLFEVQRKLRHPSKGESLFLKENSDILDERNVLLFSNLIYDNYHLRYFTRNAVSFFGYRDAKEMIGLHISQLIPMPIGIEHTKILQSKRKRTRNNKIHTGVDVVAHMITKKGTAKPVKAWAKFEVNHPNGIYAVALARPVVHPKLNSFDFLISLDGRILHMPEKVDHLFPFKRNYQDFYIFQFIPRIASFLFRSNGDDSFTEQALTNGEDFDYYSASPLGNKKSFKSFLTRKKSSFSILSKKKSIVVESEKEILNSNGYFLEESANNVQALFFVNSSEDFACQSRGTKWNSKSIEYFSKEEVDLKLGNSREGILKRTNALFRLEFDLKYVAFFDEKIKYKVLTIHKIERLNDSYIPFLKMVASAFDQDLRKEILKIKPSELRALYFSVRKNYHKILMKSALIIRKGSLGSSLKQKDHLEVKSFLDFKEEDEVLEPAREVNSFPLSENDSIVEEGPAETKKSPESPIRPYVAMTLGKIDEKCKLTEEEIIEKFFGIGEIEFQKKLREEKHKEAAKGVFIFKEGWTMEHIQSKDNNELGEAEENNVELHIDQRANTIQAESSVGDFLNTSSTSAYNDLLSKKGSTSNKIWVAQSMVIGFVFVVVFSLVIVSISIRFTNEYRKTILSNEYYSSQVPLSFAYMEYLIKFMDAEAYFANGEYNDEVKQHLDIWNTSANEMLAESKYELMNIDNFFIRNFLKESYNISQYSILERGTNTKDDIEDISLLKIIDYFNILLSEITSEEYQPKSSSAERVQELELVQYNYWVFASEIEEVYVDTDNDLKSYKNILLFLIILNFSSTCLLIFIINSIILITYLQIFKNIDNALWVITKIDHSILEKWIIFYQNLLDEIHSETRVQNAKVPTKVQAPKEIGTLSKGKSKSMFTNDFIKTKKPSFVLLFFIISGLGILLSVPAVINFSNGLSSHNRDQLFDEMKDVILGLCVGTGHTITSSFQTALFYENSTFNTEMFNEGSSFASISAPKFKNYYDELVLIIADELSGMISEKSELQILLDNIEQHGICSEIDLSDDFVTRCEKLVETLGDLGLLVAANQFYSAFNSLLVDLYSVETTFENKKKVLSSTDIFHYAELGKYLERVFIHINSHISEEITKVGTINNIVGWICLGTTAFLFFLYFFVGLNKILKNVSDEIYKTQRIISLFPHEVINNNNYIKNYLKTHFKNTK